MQTNSGTESTSDDLFLQTATNYTEKANELLNMQEISEKELKEFSKVLRTVPLFEVEVPDKVIEEDSFEILQKKKLNPIFVLNLINIINIINFVWNCTKKNVEMLHKILLDLNIMFSYLKNDDQIEYVLLSLIPLNMYEIIAKYGKKCFKREYNFDINYFSADRNLSQIGLVYQENTIIQINSLLDNKQIDTPTIMYYINNKDSQILFKNKIFNRPENFLDLDYKSEYIYSGYNEIDYSFILEEDVEIEQNCIFNKVVEDEEVKQYYNSKDEKIKILKNTNIFIEIKSKIDNNNIISNLAKNAERFSEAYAQPAYNGINKKYYREKHENFLLYNNNRKDAYNILEDNEDKEANKNIKVYYNSGYVQLASIVSLKNEIRTINGKMVEEKEKMEMQMELFKKDMEKKMSLFSKNLEDKIINLEKNNQILSFICTNRVDLQTINKYFEKNVTESSKTVFNAFNLMNKKYLNLYNKVGGDDNQIMKIANNVVGNESSSKEGIEEFLKLIKLLDSKISENKYFRSYYESYKKILVGPKWNESTKIKYYNVFFKNKFSVIIKNILRCIILLEENEGLENHFFEAVLYYVSEISAIDSSCYSYFYLYQDKKDIKKTVNNFILSLNNDFIVSLITPK